MAAYAALLSVMHIIDNLQHHSRLPISLHDGQVHLLTQKITFLQEFLEVYNPNLPYSEEADPLESRIARAAYAVEDAIESHISDQISNDGEKTSNGGLYKALEKEIEVMALIEKEVMEINKESGGFQNQLHAKSTTPADSLRSASSSSIAQEKSVMVGADKMLSEMKDKLISDAPELQTIPIVGMSGSGKTTLALNIYQDSLIREHFDVCAWATISREYDSVREILLQLLTQLIDEFNRDSSDLGLRNMLYKYLFPRKYMIILDDMWSLKAWHRVLRSLPHNHNGSRLVITTRLTTLALAYSNINSLEMKLLDEKDSWNLLSKTVFGEKGCCPSEFEEIGKKIGRRCNGLPLSILAVGRILAKSELSIESWELIEKDFNAILNSQDDGNCLNVLYTNLEHLPVHLKPCFLYMGIYGDNRVIRTSKLIRSWVAEGFIKPGTGKRPEDVAREYLKELIDRNLVLIHKMGSIGSIKECKILDLFRDLCLREAQKEGFYIVHSKGEMKYRISRIVMRDTTPEILEIDVLSPAPLARSLILDGDQELQPDVLRLLRTVGSNIGSGQFLENLEDIVNSRFFAFTLRDGEFPSLLCQFWNLKELIVSGSKYEGLTAPSEIWYMSNLRHLHFNNLYLPDPPNVQDVIKLSNLQSMGVIRDFKCSEAVIGRIPNIRKLKLVYREGVDESFCLTNLDRLDKLESLTCTFNESMCQMNYPQSLKKLNLEVHLSVCWEGILDKIGALPCLEKLQLYGGTFNGHWETFEDGFRRLEYLSLNWCQGLQEWRSEFDHFPRLHQLHLYGLDDLQEIPLDFVYTLALGLIVVERCSDSAVESAKRIAKGTDEFYVEDVTVQIQVILSEDNDPALASLESRNFHVTLLLY